MLPPRIRTLIGEVQLQLLAEQSGYRATDPRNAQIPELATEGMFHGRFDGVFRVLAELDREVQRLRDEVKVEQETQ